MQCVRLSIGTHHTYDDISEWLKGLAEAQPIDSCQKDSATMSLPSQHRLSGVLRLPNIGDRDARGTF